MSLTIRPVRALDNDAWHRIFREYIAFYESQLSEDQYALTWNRLMSEFPLHGLVADVDGRIVGLAHYLFRPSTWSTQDFCYLEDLFVEPSERGRGVGRALIAEVERIARDAGSPRLYWTTAPDNAIARALYDQVAITDRVQYKILLTDTLPQHPVNMHP
jgi:GNAT superfamily N-acetyltransferase